MVGITWICIANPLCILARLPAYAGQLVLGKDSLSLNLARFLQGGRR